LKSIKRRTRFRREVHHCEAHAELGALKRRLRDRLPHGDVEQIKEISDNREFNLGTATRFGEFEIAAKFEASGGATALFGFEVTRAGPVGVGIRSEPDRAMARLLDAAGKPLGEGVAQLHRLDPGRYFLEARIPAAGRTTTIRPAVIGIKPPPAGPPPEVTLQYLEMVGLKPPHSP